MKRVQTTTTREYDMEGKLVNEIIETVTEEDDGYIYPQYKETLYNCNPKDAILAGQKMIESNVQPSDERIMTDAQRAELLRLLENVRKAAGIV